MRKSGSQVTHQIAPRKAIVDNTNRWARIFRRVSSYGRMSAHMMCRGVPINEIVRTQFPMLSPNPSRPAQLTIELTNYCNLRCDYCSNRLGLRERGFMSEGTFSRVVDGVRRLGIKRVRVVGGGEPTLHPEFATFLKELAGATSYLSVLSNGQWRRPERTIQSMLDAPVNLVEVSVEGTSHARYKASTCGGDFSRLLDNLTLLKRAKATQRSGSMINLRIMERPSDRNHSKGLKSFWKPFGDTTMLQRLLERKGVDGVEDLFRPRQFEDQSYPTCSLPFKAMWIHWNGDVPLCYNTLAQKGPPGFMLGNVNEVGLPEIWNGKTLRAYRRAHHERIFDLMPLCKGCTGV